MNTIFPASLLFNAPSAEAGIQAQYIVFLPVRMEDIHMAAYSTTKMSSKGQVVIPEEIRLSLHLKEGDQFVVIGKGDTVILKAITPPSLEEFSELLAEACAQAKKAGLKKTDIAAAIKKARKRR